MRGLLLVFRILLTVKCKYMLFDIDVIIVAVFLIATLVIGLGHGGDVKTIKDYALGGRKFSTGALVATVVASWVSGSGFAITISRTYYDGLYYLVATFGMIISFLIIAFYLVPRMGEFLGKTSIAEAMGDLYGTKVRIIVAISGIMASVGYIAVQFRVFGDIVSYFVDLDNTLTIITAGLVVTIYSAYGGIKSVTFTDILQFFTFCFAVPLVGIMIWSKLGSIDSFSLSNALQVDKFNYKKVLNLGNPQFWEMIPLFLYFVLPKMAPSICQRIFMGNNLEQVKKVFIISAFLIIFVKITIAWIPFLIFNVNPDLEHTQLISYIMDNYTYTGLKGLIIVCVIAMAMSSADTDINISSVLFSNDICSLFSVTSEKKLLLSKIFACVLGLVAIFFALSTTDLLDIILTTSSFYMPIVSSPLILTIFGFRSTEKSVLIGMGAGAFTVVAWKAMGIQANPIAIAMLVNLIFLMGSHYL
ncbi:MAG: hypothetical protein COA94_03610, partial [Rickettsiales bacterium]